MTSETNGSTGQGGAGTVACSGEPHDDAKGQGGIDRRDGADGSERQTAVVIIVSPVGRGKFRAWLEGGPELVHASATPFLAGCRKLLALGYDPRQRAAMRHLGTDHDALSATIGAAAGLTVGEQGTPRFVRLPGDGLPQHDGSPRIAPNQTRASGPAGGGNGGGR
jgi:hypothetical protein